LLPPGPPVSTWIWAEVMLPPVTIIVASESRMS